jgi:hypothetical protein
VVAMKFRKHRVTAKQTRYYIAMPTEKRLYQRNLTAEVKWLYITENKNPFICKRERRTAKII